MLNRVQRQDIISMYEATGSIRAVARELGMSRKTVKSYMNEYVSTRAGGDEALATYLKSEPRYRTPLREKTTLTQAVREVIDVYLSDIRGVRRTVPPESASSARLIGLAWTASLTGGGEFYLTLGGRRTKVYMAVFTLAYSNHRMAYLFLRQDTQAYLEAHRRYFRDMNGIPHRMVYDNMRVAVDSFMSGKLPTDALVRLEAGELLFNHLFLRAEGRFLLQEPPTSYIEGLARDEEIT